MRYLAVVEKVDRGDPADLWVYQVDGPDRSVSVFGDLVWLDGQQLLDVLGDRLHRAGWQLIGAWQREGEHLVADVEHRPTTGQSEAYLPPGPAHPQRQ